MNMSLATEMSIFEYLNLRSRWEEIVKDFTLNDSQKTGQIENIRAFVHDGAKGNRFRKGYDEAIDIAQHILERS